MTDRFVYVAAAPTGWSKIGIARNPQTRIPALRLSPVLGPQVRIVAAWPTKCASFIETLALCQLRRSASDRRECFRVPARRAIACVERAFEHLGAKPSTAPASSRPRRTNYPGQPPKLSPDDVKKAMKMIEAGDSVKEVAASFGVVPATIYNNLRGTLTTLRGKAKRKRRPTK